MPRALTSPELTLLRGDTQWSKLYLAALPPNVIYSARLNGVPASNDRVSEISFDTGSGTLANVKTNMTLYVGTDVGKFDLGMVRIRKEPIAGTFYIGLTSSIVWADNCYLTVVDDFDWDAKHPTVSAGVLSMDVDVEYDDQHADFNPVVIMGSHAAGFVEDGEFVTEWDASDSWVFDSEIESYLWEAPGASSSSGMTTATPTIGYDTPGKRYCVYCTVTATNGKSTTGVRHVFPFDRDENMPATVFQLAQCVGDYNTGGWMFDMVMEAEAGLSEIRDRSLIILFAEDWYGTTKQSIGPLENRENIVCMGRIVGESLRWDREAGLVHFTVQGAQHWLNKIKAFPVELTFAGAATSWGEMPELTTDRALWHILQWRSTVIETMDFYPTNDTRYRADAKTIGSMVWSQLVDLAFHKIFASPGVNRFNQLFVEIDPQMVPEADRDWATVMALTDDDWTEGLDFGRETVHDVSLISLNAEEVNSGGFSVTRYSLSPGHVPLRYGEPELADLLLCESQTQANEMAGLLLGWRLNEFPDIPVPFAQNNRMLDIFPRQFCSFSMSADDTPRGVTYDGNVIPRRMAIYFDGDTGFMRSEVNFEGETFAQPAVDGDVPESEDVDFSTPPIPDLPSLPDLPVLLPGLDFSTPTVSGPPKVLVHSPNKGLLYSKNFNSAAPTWVPVNAGLTLAQYQAINRIVICPNGAIYVGGVTTSPVPFLARAPYVGATFIVLEDATSIATRLGQVGYIATFNCNKLKSEEVILVLNPYAFPNSLKFHTYRSTGAGGFGAEILEITGVEAAYANISYGNGYWLMTCLTGAASQWIRISADFTSIVDRALTGDGFFGTIFHTRVGTTGKTYHHTASDGTIAIGENNCATFTTGIGSEYNTAGFDDSIFATDPTGNYIMCQRNTTGKGKSSDGGYTLVDIAALPIGAWNFDYAGGSGSTSRWVAVGAGGYIYYSENFGVSWSDRRGNVVQVDPIASFNIVKVLEF